jgi:phage tail tape-measure protein
MAFDSGGAMGGAAQGAQMGATFGPWGAAIGAVVGGVAGGLAGGAAKRKAMAQAERVKAEMFRQASEQNEAYLLQHDAYNKNAKLLQQREEFAIQAEDLTRKQLNQKGVEIDLSQDEAIDITATRKRRGSFFKSDTSANAL